MKSVKMHKLEGTFREDRHSAKAEAPVLGRIPSAPQKLNERAAEYWRKKCLELKEIQMLHSIDTDALARLCLLYSAADRIEEDMNNAWGQQLYYDRLKDLDRVSKLILPLEKEFGFTPISRGRLNVPEKKQQDPFDGI